MRQELASRSRSHSGLFPLAKLRFVGSLLLLAVGRARMQMNMLVDRRAKAVLERDRTKPRAGLSRRFPISWHIRGVTKPLFDLFQKYPRQRRHRLWPVGEYATQPFRH